MAVVATDSASADSDYYERDHALGLTSIRRMRWSCGSLASRNARPASVQSERSNRYNALHAKRPLVWGDVPCDWSLLYVVRFSYSVRGLGCGPSGAG